MSSSITGQVSNAGTALNKRLAAFRQRFSTVLGRHHGYDELSTLEQPLVQDGHPTEVYDQPESSYFQQHGVSRPGQQTTASPRIGGANYTASATTVPDPVGAHCEADPVGHLTPNLARFLISCPFLQATQQKGKGKHGCNKIAFRATRSKSCGSVVTWPKKQQRFFGRWQPWATLVRGLQRCLASRSSCRYVNRPPPAALQLLPHETPDHLEHCPNLFGIAASCLGLGSPI